MDEVTALLSESGPDLQCTVQRKLGRCMLQLRQCVAQSHRGGNQCESVGAASFGSHFFGLPRPIPSRRRQSAMAVVAGVMSIHEYESQQFEVRKQSLTLPTVVWYRSRLRETSKEQE